MVLKSTMFPQVDMLLISKNSRIQRRKANAFLPRIGLNCVDYARSNEIDTFYLLCQDQRDYYRDPYNKLHSVNFFETSKTGNQINKANPQTQYCQQPNEWVTESKPAIYPLSDAFKNSKRFPTPITLRGQYDQENCLKYKR